MYIIRNILVDITNKRNIKYHLAKKVNINESQINSIEIIRRSIDDRKRGRIQFNYTILADITGKFPKNSEIDKFETKATAILPSKQISEKHPFIIGAGPAGLFTALSLVEQGFTPYIFERGETIAKRTDTVENFWESGELNTESNVQFGEGGAGTFSDGKLTARGRDHYTNQVFDKLIQFGADEDIKVDALPHLGTDGLKQIITKLRKYLEDKGCKFHFNSKLTDFKTSDNKISGVCINDTWYKPEIIILAIGNAARDTFEMLSEKINIESKSFAVGFRIEHSRDFINDSFYGKKTDLSITGAATYRLTAKLGNRGIYSFCMCPGGEVIASSSEPEQIVTNGMSYSKRENFYSNSAIVTSVTPEDFGKDALAGMHFQRMLESACYNPDKPYYAPVQKASDFMTKSESKGLVPTSYRPLTYNADLNEIFPKFIYSALKTGLAKFDKTAPGFIENGTLIAPETRTSSPIRITRDRASFEAIGFTNLYPIGEGSGYAGGIMSSAVDGYKIGKIFQKAD